LHIDLSGGCTGAVARYVSFVQITCLCRGIRSGA